MSLQNSRKATIYIAYHREIYWNYYIVIIHGIRVHLESQNQSNDCIQETAH